MRCVASLHRQRVHVYGDGRDKTLAKALALSYSVLADEVEHGERDAQTLLTVTFDTREAASPLGH